MAQNHQKISPLLLSWYDADHADLPWRHTRDPYAVWVSEIMAQQTQIATMLPYFERWMAQFPTIQALANAPLDDVLKLWEGLGYYSRARNLHAAAQTVVNDMGGNMPQTAKELQRLKGIGRYTASAIASICFGEQVGVLDGNVIRVLSRLYNIEEDVTKTSTKKQLWTLAESLVPAQRPGDHNQAIMELGQRVCTPQKPTCLLCPIRIHCQAQKHGTQLERPVKPPRKRTPHFDVVAGIIRSPHPNALPEGEGFLSSKFLITQRPPDGLLGGLWEFPGGKVEAGETHTKALQREIMEELGIVIGVGDHQTTVKHAFTHFRITLYAYHATHNAGIIQHLGVHNHAWVTLADLDQYAFAKTDRMIIESLQE
jgi:A/G-specific adenine glycosylase